jgi:hypothetical protein
MKSSWASAVSRTIRLWDDIRLGARTTLEALIRFPSHLLDQFGGKDGVLAPVELVETDLQLGAKLFELALLLIQQAHRFAHDFARVREVSLRHPLLDASLDIRGKLNGH